MPDVDRLLAEAGERWRAGQPGSPSLDPATLRRVDRPARLWPMFSAVIVVALAAVALGGLWAGRPPSGISTPTPTATVPAPTVPASCLVTAPRDDLGPLAPLVADLSLPSFLGWYGSPGLYTWVPRSGSAGPSTFIRTFWYSRAWSPADEPDPTIVVSAGRFGRGGESIIGGRAVSARSSELGTSMIVALELPSGGCWQIDATYRDQSLSYVVWVPIDGPTPSEPTPTPPSSAPSSTRPPSGYSQAAAIEAAVRLVDATGQTSLTVTGAVSGPYALVGGGGGVAAERWVWAVTVMGLAPPPDCPSGAPCPIVLSTTLVTLDYVDGTFLVMDSGSLAPAPFGEAVNLVSKLEVARVAGDWAEAWAVLSPLSQARIGSLEAFAALESAYDAKGGGFVIDDVVDGPFDEATRGYIGSELLDDLVGAGGDPSRAWLVYVTHPDEDGASASSVAYLVAEVGAGWRVWIAH